MLDLPLVRDDVLHPLVQHLGEPDPVPGRPLPDQGEGVVQGRGQMEPPSLQPRPPGLHLGQVQG